MPSFHRNGLCRASYRVLQSLTGYPFAQMVRSRDIGPCELPLRCYDVRLRLANRQPDDAASPSGHVTCRAFRGGSAANLLRRSSGDGGLGHGRPPSSGASRARASTQRRARGLEIRRAFEVLKGILRHFAMAFAMA